MLACLKPTLVRRCLPTAGCISMRGCQDGSKANRRRHPARLREHVATFFIVVQRWLRAKYRKVAWFAENVVCAEFAGAMKVLIPGSKYKVVNHASFSAERRARAYFASAEFDLTALTRLTGTCTVAEFFDIDQGFGPYLMRSGSSGSKSNCMWLSIDQQAPALTSNGLLMRNERTGAEWRVPSDDMAKLRSLAALPKSTTADVTARCFAVPESPLKVLRCAELILVDRDHACAFVCGRAHAYWRGGVPEPDEVGGGSVLLFW